MKRRGQVTIFIIVGIVIALGIGTYIVVSSQEESSSQSYDSFEDYMKACLEDVIIASLNTFDENPIVFYAYAQNNAEDHILSFLEWEILNNAQKCAFSYHKGSLEIGTNPDERSVFITLSQSQTSFKVIYPVTITQDEKTQVVTEYPEIVIDRRLSAFIATLDKVVSDQEMHPQSVCFTCIADFANENDLYITMSSLTPESYLLEVQDYTFGSPEEFYSIYVILHYGRPDHNETV